MKRKSSAFPDTSSFPGHPDYPWVLPIMQIQFSMVGMPQRLTNPTGEMRVRGCNDHTILLLLNVDNPTEGVFFLGHGLLMMDRIKDLLLMDFEKWAA
jgi:hypothetical protein